MTVQVQSVSKTEDTVDVIFQSTLEQPVVIVTPYWRGGGTVGYQETITSLTPNGCSITSGNAADNYFVNVLAVESDITHIGDIKATAGSHQKEEQALEIDFPAGALTSPDPATLLSSHWRGSDQGVGFIDTVDDLAASECRVISGNADIRYYTHFLAMDIGIWKDSGQRVATGIVNKTSNGLQRVYFPTAFDTPPTVFVSPWWNNANAAVGSVETIHRVNEHFCEANSANAAANYFVAWAAVGR